MLGKLRNSIVISFHLLMRCGYLPGILEGSWKAKCPAVRTFSRISAKSAFSNRLKAFYLHLELPSDQENKNGFAAERWWSLRHTVESTPFRHLEKISWQGVRDSLLLSFSGFSCLIFCCFLLLRSAKIIPWLFPVVMPWISQLTR